VHYNVIPLAKRVLDEMEEVGELIDFAEKVINFVKDIQSAN